MLFSSLMDSSVTFIYVSVAVTNDITIELSKKEPYLSEPDHIYIGKKNVLLATATFTGDLPGLTIGMSYIVL